jgi:hypothetical protein
MSLAVTLYMPSALDRFKREAEIIGRLVIEYGEMEWDLCLLVSHIIQNLDTALKAMYRSRGETQRIDVADSLARNRLEPGRIRDIYEQTIAQMRTCLKIRNQYAHTNWVQKASGELCFVNIEELAKGNNLVELSDMKLYMLDMNIIEDQARYFRQVMQNMRYLNMEIQHMNGTSTLTGFHYVRGIKPPKFAQPLPD